MNLKHGKSKTLVYGVWNAMLTRCNNSNCEAYENYGGRGIKVCDEWKKFENFIADMGMPGRGMTLERLDNDKGYYPGNCEWVTRSAQGRNKRNNVLIEIDGETHPLIYWADKLGIPYATAHQRIRIGWAPVDAVRVPKVTNRKGVPRGRRIYNHGVEFGEPMETAS